MSPRFRFIFAACLALVLSMGLIAGANAQQASPVSTVVQSGDTRAFPATINEGTCDQVGTLWYDLAPVGLPEGGQIVAPPAVAAYESVTAIPDTQVDNFANGKYILVVGRSQEAPDEIVACGFIGGTRYGDNLLFSILPNGDSSDFGGVVMMTQSGADVTVTIHLMAGAENSDATPVAAAPPATTQSPVPGQLATTTPEGNSESGQTELTVNMVDIAFDPKELTIAAGTDVIITLTNTGAAVHNFSIDELEVHSGDVAPGATTTVTINAQAGEYEFYCSIPGHKEAGMIGKIFVQ